jgi:hypothetical protein
MNHNGMAARQSDIIVGGNNISNPKHHQRLNFFNNLSHHYGYQSCMLVCNNYDSLCFENLIAIQIDAENFMQQDHRPEEIT